MNTTREELRALLDETLEVIREESRRTVHLPPALHRPMLEADNLTGNLVVRCSCLWGYTLGPSTTPEQAYRVSRMHLADVEPL
jgi:hypothetical protein